MNRVAVIAVVAAGIFGTGLLFVLSSNRNATPATRQASPAAGAAPAASTTPTPRTSPDASTPAAAETPATPAPRRAPRASTSPAPVEPRTEAPTRSTLRIVSDVPGAQVFLNRQFVGATPVTATDLAAGEYQINVSAPGYDNHVETVTLTPGERELAVNFRVVRLNASLRVIHKHRFGSCTGTLVATPEGLRYQTADKDDAFSAGLLEMETFQVDYLNKNLRVQPRKGKRYDFTDPEGNADRLFVFHRDVERARERLKNGDAPSSH